MRKRTWIGLGVPFSIVGTSILVLNCYSDEDTTVDIPTDCDVAQLRADPVETPARLFVETSVQLRDRVNELEKRFIDVCNAINREVGTQEGRDIRSACNPIATRLEAAQKLAPIPDGGAVAPTWVNVAFTDACQRNTKATADCLVQCGAACDIAKDCPAGNVSGKCSGTCTGTCEVAGPDTPCVGECRGACDTPDGGISCTAAECVGACTGTTWTGQCAQGCDTNFLGRCDGTCTGTCDGNPVNQKTPVDAGSDTGTDAGDPDAGDDGGMADAGVPDAAPEAGGGGDAGGGQAPGGADGNCKGVCRGQCSANASGSCAARCRGGYSGGECGGGPSRCNGVCSGASIACTTECKGTCVSAFPAADAGTCPGICTGSCSVPFTEPACAANLTCPASEQCADICAVKGAIATKCEPPLAFELRVVGDLAMYNALSKHLPELASLVREVNILNDDSVRIAQVTIEDYKKLGPTRDRVRVCITSASRTVSDARAQLGTVVGATSVLDGLKF